jgi:predicted permease
MSGRAGEMLGLYSHDRTRPDSYRPFSYPNYVDIRDRNDVFDGLVAYAHASVGVPAGDVTRRAAAQIVSANYFSTIDVSLAAGRTFTADEDKPGANIPVVIASYARWQESGFDPAFLGRTLRINTQDFTIVGIVPKGFTGTSALMGRELWLPLGVFESIIRGRGRAFVDRTSTALLVAGRLKPGITVDQANARLAALSVDLERSFPAENRHQVLTVHALSRVNITSRPSSDAGPAMMSAVLMPLSGGVLAIACLNIANMLLARGTTRKKEIAIRLALGGGRARIVRQLLTESLVLATAGGSAGLIVGWWAARLFKASLVPVFPMPLQLESRPDLNVVLATTALAVLSAVVSGLAPALRITRPDVVDDLKDLGGARDARGRFRTRASLVVCQIALSLMLVTAGGLFARGALRAAAGDPGYRYDGLLLASIDPGLAGYDEAQGHARLQSALERLRRVPGIEAAGATSQVPFGELHAARSITRPGQLEEPRLMPTYSIVSAGYFTAIGLPILRGRDFTAAEQRAGQGPRVAIIDEPLARRLFPNEDPLGQQVILPPQRGDTAPASPEAIAIVGVVPGIRDDLFEHELAPHIYVPSEADYRGTMHVHARVTRGSGDEMLGTIRRELRAVDDRLPVTELRTMQEFHDRGLLLWVIRTAGRTLTGLGGLALLLAVVGVYGVRSYVVSQRTREIGIRLALGARPRDIAWMLVRDGARTTLAGIAIGFPLAVAVGRVLSAEIYDVHPYDPLVLTLAPLVLTSAAALATYLPARRGMRVSPLDALRTE